MIDGLVVRVARIAALKMYDAVAQRADDEVVDWEQVKERVAAETAALFADEVPQEQILNRARRE